MICVTLRKPLHALGWQVTHARAEPGE
jgi:hypothetical protein